jgi:nitric oxide reductase subunit B
MLVWTGVSVILLLSGIAGMVWWYASRRDEPRTEPLPTADPLQTWQATPSQRATLPYFYVVGALVLVQMALGVVVAHYGVEGDGFYGIPLSRWLPYSVARTWHVQMGLFWIATAWLGPGCLSARWSATTSRPANGWACWSCSRPCWWSSPGRWPASG